MADQVTTGCFLDPALRDATAIELQSKGFSAIIGDTPTIKGAWERAKSRGEYVISLAPLMHKYYPGRAVDFQNGNRNAKPAPDEGTCVSRGTYRACTLAYLRALDNRIIIGRPQIISYAAVYGFGRVIIGKRKLGRSGGAYGGWMAKAASILGFPSCESIGLPDDGGIGRTDLATKWGYEGPPAEVLAASKGHQFDSHLARNVDEQIDALAARYPAAFCRSTLNSGKRDADGLCYPAESGGHCEEAHGVLLDYKSRNVILMQQSWGQNSPSGPDEIKLYGGGVYKLGPGEYGILASDQKRVFNSDAESWHFQIREGSQWR